jgi:hypothetical protein
MKFRYRGCTYNTDYMSAEDKARMFEAIQDARIRQAEKQIKPEYFAEVVTKPKKKKGH